MIGLGLGLGLSPWTPCQGTYHPHAPPPFVTTTIAEAWPGVAGRARDASRGQEVSDVHDSGKPRGPRRLLQVPPPRPERRCQHGGNLLVVGEARAAAHTVPTYA
eukprot:scaffold859_cov306-Pinguiococcus_pyrenoidosus.AAC.17